MAQETHDIANQSGGKTLSELGNIVAFVGHEVEFAGVLTYKGNVRIDGTFEGEIETDDTLFIGEQAQVTAQIRAGSVIASGRIKGDIVAGQRVELKSPAVIDASISTPKLSMDNGVIFNGKVTMGSAIEQNKKTKVREPLSEVKQESLAAEDSSTTGEGVESSGVTAQDGSQAETVPS